MIRYLFGRIAARVAALWRPAFLSARTGRKRTAAARDTETMDAYRPAGGVGLDAGEGAAVARISPDDLLAGAMVSVDLDFDRLSRHDSPWLREMRLTCRSCNARGRCRRDLGTGDFARRYRHYCPNADSLVLLAAAEQSHPRQEPRQEH